MPSYNNHNGINLSEIDMYIFDLDGTLYDQHYIRKKMLRKLIFALLRLQISPKELQIIKCFREQRELHKGYASACLEQEQFTWCATKYGVSPDYIERLIRKWMLEYPLKHLRKALYPGVADLFNLLHTQKKKIVIFSDYPIENKLKALGLISDGNYCSTSPEIGELKPGTRGIDLICLKHNCKREKVIYFGDREDTDGESARKSGVSFIRVDAEPARKGMFFPKIINRLKEANE